MSDEFDDRLRDALRPVDAPGGFAERVAARIAQTPRPVAKAHWIKRWFGTPQRGWATGSALAASILVTVVAGNLAWQQHREREGLEARKQVLEALQVTSRKLDLAYQAVNGRPTNNSGA
jgi:hypothetical protein